MDELRDYLETEFAKMGQQLLDAMDLRLNELRAEARGDIRGLRGEMNELREESRDGIRQTHVLIEQARDEIRTVAEGVASNTERIERLREEGHRERQEIRNELLSHLRSSHQGLDRRVSRLEEIVADSRRMPRL